jgi:hypothetical protein
VSEGVLQLIQSVYYRRLHEVTATEEEAFDIEEEEFDIEEEEFDKKLGSTHERPKTTLFFVANAKACPFQPTHKYRVRASSQRLVPSLRVSYQDGQWAPPRREDATAMW